MKHYVIWSFEHKQWWKSDHAGYTPHLDNAGLYTAEEAGDIVTSSVLGEEVALLFQTALLMGQPTVSGLWQK